MTRKFFINNTITTAEDISALVSAFRSFHFVNNERAEALAELTAIIDEFNAELKNTAVGTIANSDNIVSAMIPAFTIDEKTAKNSNARKRAVLNAISYEVYKVDTEKNEIRKTTRAVTVRDIYAYNCDLLASKHADSKVTKQDRENAKRQIVNTATADAFRLFMVGAFRFENVSEDLIKDFNFSANSEEYKLFLLDKPSKANAEKQIKKTAENIGLEAIPFRRIHALTLYKRAYTIDKGHQPKVADILDFTQDFIISARYAKNNIELPDTTDKSGIFATEDTASTADNVWKF